MYSWQNLLFSDSDHTYTKQATGSSPYRAYQDAERENAMGEESLE